MERCFVIIWASGLVFFAVRKLITMNSASLEIKGEIENGL